MDFINFYNLIYFLRDYARGTISKYFSTEHEVSDIDKAIAYYSLSPDALYSAIVSSDISLIRINCAQTTLKEYSVLLRNITKALDRGVTLTGYIDANQHSVYLRDFLLKSLNEDLLSELQSFFILSRRFLEQCKKLTPKDTNYRLTTSMVANVIYMQHVFSSIQDDNN